MAIVIDGKFKPADPLGLYSRKANPLGASPVARTAYNPLEGNPDNEFNTPLTPAEEKAFQAWKAKYRPDDTGEDYDLRGAFKAGLTPDPSNDHFPDTYKKPNHPTFSTESRYAQFAADMAGSWDEAGNYVPSEARARREAEAKAAAETLQAQATHAELEKQSPGRYRLISEAEWERWKADWDKANRSTGLVGDTIKLLDSGVAGLEQSINEIVGQIPVIGKPLQEMADAFDKFAYGSPGYAQRMQDVIDRNVATLTPEMEQARGEVWWNEETNSLGGAWLNPRSYFAGAVESLPSMAATMAPAMWLARGAYLGAIAKGATERVAAAAAAKTAMVAGAVTEGGLGGAETALAVKERIQAIPREKLLEADAVQALITQGMSEDAAIEAIMSDAATQAFVMGGVATGMFGGFGDRFLAKLIAEGVGGNVAKRIVQGAVRGIVSEGLLEELPQEAFGQLSQNMALQNTVSPEQDLGEGVLNAAMGGAAIGGVMGAGIGGVGGAARPAPPVPAPDSSDEVIAPGPAPHSPSGEQDAAPVASAPTPKGPLASAVDYGLANGADAPPPMAPVAATTEVIPDETPVPVSPVTEGQAPTAGANVVVEAEGLPRFVARLEGYTQGSTGPEALVIDTSTGEELQVPLAAIRTAKLTEQMVEQMDAPPPVERKKQNTPADTTRTVGNAQMVLPDAVHAQLYDLGKERRLVKGLARVTGDDALEAAQHGIGERKALADALGIPEERVFELADDYRYRVERAAKSAARKGGLPQNMHAINTQLLQRFQIERLKAEKQAQGSSSAPLAPLSEDEEQAIYRKAQAEMDETNFPDVADDFAEQAVAAARQERLKQIEDAAEAARDAKPGTTPTDRAKSIADKYLPVDEAANAAATSPRNDLPEPTQAQKEAGNYKLGHIALGGLNISIENPAGSERKGTDKGGKAWSVQMKHHYGYIKGTVGRDKDHIDVFVKEGVGEVADDAPVFVVDQVVDGEFDEHKVMLGFKSLAQARNAYKANYTKGWKGLGAITQTTLGEFKAWTRDGDTSKQFAHAAEPTGGVKQQAPALEASATQPPDMTTKPAPATSAPLENATAPEHVATGVDDRELGQIVAEFKDAQSDMMQGEHPVSNIFQPPKRSEVVRLGDKVKVHHKDHGWMTPAEARRQIEKWRAAAIAQGEDPAIRSANSNKVVLSLFDLSGKWSEPWEAAGYQVYRFDIQDNPETGDVNNFSAEFFGDWFGDFDGQEIYAVLAACPCTDFAVSGARHFAAKDADGRTVASVKLVQQTLRVIEYFKPAVWAVENPVGRIEKLGGLPPWRLSFDPNHLGDPYTKKTLIWGRFNADLPIAPVEPTEGSKMWAKFGGKSMATKNARSETPEGFAYGFFAANNAHDHPAMAVANKFDRLDRGLIETAIDAGVTPEQITSAVEDFYYMDLDDQAANDAIAKLAVADLADETVEQRLTAEGPWDFNDTYPEPLWDRVAAMAREGRYTFTLAEGERVDVEQVSSTLEEALQEIEMRRLDMFEATHQVNEITAGRVKVKGSVDQKIKDLQASIKEDERAIEELGDAYTDVFSEAAVRALKTEGVRRAKQRWAQQDKGAQVRVPKAVRPTIESKGKSDTPTGLPTGLPSGSAKKTNSNKGVEPRHPLLDETGLHPIVGEKNAINRWLNDLPQEDYDLLSEEYRGRLAIEIGMTSEPAKTFRHMKEDLAAAKARNAPKADSQTLVEKIHAKLPAGYGAEAIEGGIRVFRRYDDWTVQTLIGTPAASDVTAMLDRLHKEEASFAGPPSEQRTKPSTNGATVRQNSVDADGADPFAKNKLFTADKVAAAKARLKSKMGQLNSGIDPEVLVDGMTIAGAYIEAGVRDFADYARQMADDFGPRIRPYLLSFWEGARNYPGLDAKGMTPPAESARLHAELNTELPVEEAPALGQELAKPKKRTPKTGRGGDRTLIQDFGVEHIDGWTEGSNGEGEPTDFGLRGGVKDHFLKDATGYLQAVSAILHDQGWAPAEDNKGRPMKAVSKNEAGPAVSGDVSLTLFHPETSGRIHVTVTASSLRGTVPSTPSGVSIMFRTGVEMDRFASRAMNQWAPVDLSAADFAKLLQEQADRAARFAKPGEASAEDRQRVIEELKGAIARPSLAPQEASDEPTGTDEPAADRGSAEGAGELRSPGEPRPQRAPAPEDRVDLAAAESADVAPAADRRSRRASRKGAAAADVGGAGSADLFGAADDGRARAGREGASDARAGDGAAGTGGAGASVEPVKAPAAVSPANRGPGNFHIEDPLTIVGGGQVARFEKNRRAIELANTLRDEGRRATREEQEVLAGYTGWGSFGQDLFQGTWAQPRPKAGWEARDTWLRENLGQKEWESLQRSITNAHYTDPPTVLAMWDMVKRMGFGGGRVLEPSMGIGNFFGMMPVELANRSSLSGIELEQVTGEMAKLLYPDANISIMGYQSSKTPDDFYDLVIGNWPFEDTVIADRRYNKFSPFLHDYFYLKALDQVRPGGIVMGITSKGTMDKKESVIRTELAKKGELVAAFRLPSGAFEEYAGTNVVTDIIILRKRPAPLGSAADAGWIKSVPYRTPAGEEVSVNEYFVEHPDHVIGTIDFGHGTTFRRPGLIVHRPADMMGQLERIKALVPEGAYRPERREARQISYITNHTDDREGALVSTRDGLFIVRGEHLAPANEVAKYELKDAKATAQRVEQLTKLIDMRRAYAALIAAERSGTGDPEAARKTLKGQYDSFVSSHGPISESYGLSYLSKIDDPFYPALAALEQRTDKGPRPAQILRSSTIRGKRTIDKPSIADAFVLARNTSIDPSLAEIAKLAGRPEAEVRAELIESGAVFETPAGDIVPSDIYLSGNVREKMRQARAGLDAGNAAMQRNIDALAKVIPPDVPYYSIEVQMGASWVPTHVYADYVAHMLNAGSSDGIAVTYTAGRWRITLSDALKARPEASAGFGTAAYRFQKLVNAAISNQTVTIRKEDSDGNVYVDQEATQEVNEKIANIRGGFGDWLWSDPERRVDLEAEYNEVRNAYASPSFDGSFLTFEGMALSLGRGPFDLREHQVNAIWRALVTRRSLNAHEVGTGKTFTMGGIAVESRRYGIARKPLIFAHNANSASVAAEIQQMYPAAKVLYIDNLAPAQIDVKMRQIANDDWDAIVVPHSLISRFALTEETLMAQAAEEIAAIEAEAYAAAADDGSTLTERMLDDPDELKKLRSPTAKDLVKTRNRIIENIRKQGQRASKEGAIPFEELGVDMVLVDEAHEFKKPPFSTRMRIKGLNTQSSDRSIALSFLLRYIRSTQNGGNVHLFTGTPVTNTLTEVFHMMRYIMAEEMSAVDVDQWDGWFGSFAREVQDVELNAAAEYEAVNRLAGFINVPELRRMIGQYMDVVFASDMPEMQPRRTQSGKTLDDKSLSAKEQAELLNGRTEGAKDRPYKKVIVETADLTPYQQQAFREIQRYAQRWRNFNGKEKKEAMLAGAPESPIIYENLAAKASFDVRLMRGEDFAGKEGQTEDDPNSKASRVVRNVLEIYNSSPLATQVVFTNAGLSNVATRSTGATGEKSQVRFKVFSTVQDIVERLVQQGIPRDQIAIVDGSTSKEKRKEVADAMNLAKIRVVIGSTQSLGVGVNMQRNLRAMHHMDAPWMPGDLEQRNGRGLRQGNQWNTVLEYRYLTDRIDGRRWQVLAIKQRFINAFLRADDSTRVIEGDAASEEESDILTTFAEAAGDPRVLIRAKLRKKIDQLLNRRRMHDNGVVDARRSADRLEKRRTELEAEHKRLVPIAEKADALSQAMAGDGFRLKLGKQEFDKRGEAREAIDSMVDGMADFGPGAEPRVIGEFGGHPLRVEWPRRSENHVLAVVIDREPIIGFAGSLQSLEATLRKYRAGVDEMVVEIREAARSAERLAAQAKEAFHQQGDLARAEREFAALELDLAQNPVPPPAWLRSGAPVDTEIFWNREKHVVSGHRWNSAGWFVLTSSAEGPVEIPYLEARDEQGMQLYEERPFVAPEVVEKASKSEGSTGPGEDGDAVADIAPAGRAFHAPRTEAVIDEIANSPFGEVVANLMEMGRVRIVAGAGSRAPSPMAMAWTEPDGRITLNASLIEPGESVGVLLHEAFHSGAERLIGSKAWTELQAELQAILKQFSRGNGRARQFYDAARDRIARAREEVTISDALAAEELAAYAIEEYETAPKVLRDWVDKLVGVVKAWLLRRFGRQLGAVTPAQLREIAAMALRDAVGGTSPSQRASILPAWPTRSEAFKRWFGKSKVVDESGQPLVVYHGTASDFAEFRYSDDIGFHFGSQETARARITDAGYGDAGVVVPVYLSAQNLLRLPDLGTWQPNAVLSALKDAGLITDGKARRVLADGIEVDRYFVGQLLQDNGYDGVVYANETEGGGDSYIVFRPEQIKSVHNGGGFDPHNPNMRASIKAPKPADVKASAKGTWTDVQPHLLATVPLTYFTELARPNMTAVDQYLKVKRQMDAYRGELHAEADALAQDWLKFSRLGGLFRSEAGDAQTAALARLMHDATLAGVDPSKTDEETRKLPGYEKLRENFRSLPAEAQRLFVRVRDAYADQARELDDLIIASVEKAQKLAQKKARETYEAEVDRIRSSGLKGLELKEALDAASDRFAKDNIRSTYANKARATKLRQQFENNRVPTPYFPLARFGRYTVTVRDQEGAVVSFSRRERAADNTRLAEEMKAAYPKYTVETGVIDEAGAGFRDAMDPRIVADIQKILGDSGVDSSVMDAIWQRYLQSMPDLSTRKRFIHRKGTAGFEGDALRAFSSHMFHASHQMARLKHGLDLQEMLDQAAIQARKSDDPIRGGTLVNELGKRHKWVMNPTGSSAVQAVTSAMFVWYLGLTPAAALVNLTQTPMLGVPIIGARFGVAKTAAALLQASRDFVAGKADMRQSPKITAEEREILNRFYESGLIDRTQSHELAGVGDTGVRYSALRSRIMGVISWAFHKTEVANREVTALAAYRLARGSGLSVQAALDAAHDLTWKVHFDYSNSSRPRLLQGDAAKLLLVFQNYQLNMWYRLARDMHQALKGETPQGRKEARYQLAGMVGMMTLLGGVSGLFGFHVLMSVLGLFLDDRDDPYTFEEEMRRNTLDLFGPDVGGMILNGVPGHLLKIDLTSRIGMPDLFVRTPDNASIEGRDWWQEMIVNALGVVPSTVINFGDGFGLMAEGNMVRGLELMMPKAFKDVMQAYRFANEGLTTRRGDEIRPADQFSAYDFVIKAMGFTPAAVAETYDRNSALMNAQTRVMDRRQMLLNQYALALQNGDEVLLQQALERIRAFNAIPAHQGVRITRDTVRRSLAARRRNAEKREDGVLIQNDQLSRDLRALQPGRVNN